MFKLLLGRCKDCERPLCFCTFVERRLRQIPTRRKPSRRFPVLLTNPKRLSVLHFGRIRQRPADSSRIGITLAFQVGGSTHHWQRRLPCRSSCNVPGALATWT